MYISICDHNLDAVYTSFCCFYREKGIAFKVLQPEGVVGNLPRVTPLHIV